MEKKTKKCDHASCACMTTDDSGYCSTFCSGHAGSTDIECTCGHPGCGNQAGGKA